MRQIVPVAIVVAILACVLILHACSYDEHDEHDELIYDHRVDPLDCPQYQAVVKQDVETFLKEVSGKGESWQTMSHEEGVTSVRNPRAVLLAIVGRHHRKEGRLTGYDPEKAADMLEGLYVKQRNRKPTNIQLAEQEVEMMETKGVNMSPVREVLEVLSGR